MFNDDDSHVNIYNNVIRNQGLYNNDQVNLQFFASQNIDKIQKMIQHKTYQETKQRISRQSDTELFLIMQSIHKQHGRNLPTHTQQQIDELNLIVTEEAFKLIKPRLLQYIGYMNTLDNRLNVLDYGQNTSSSGEKF